MPGASPQTRLVKNLNANWTPAPEHGHGTFELMLITDDDHVTELGVTSPAEVSALTALAQAGTVMAWDPDHRTLIIANIIGTMPWTTREQASKAT